MSPQCVAPTSTPDDGLFEFRWGGQVADIFTDDGLHGVTTEDGGRIRVTTDGGATWAFGNVPQEVRGPLRAAHWSDDHDQLPIPPGWAVGEDGIVLKSLDGGFTWTNQAQLTTFGKPTDLWDVHFVTSDKGWVVGVHEVFITTDGGDCWTRANVYDKDGNCMKPSVLSNKGIKMYGVDALEVGSDLVGLVVAEPGLIFRTTQASGGTEFHEVFDISELQLIQAPCANGGSPLSLWDVEISRNMNDLLAVAVGGWGIECGVILASTATSFVDLGDRLLWHQELHACADQMLGCGDGVPSTPSPHDNFKVLYGVGLAWADNSGIAAGYNGTQLKRRPAVMAMGNMYPVWQDFSQFSNLPPDPINNPVFPLIGADMADDADEDGTGWLVGFNEHIRYTMDGGESYAAQGSGGPYRNRGLDFVSETTGFMCGGRWAISKTCDGGDTWVDVDGATTNTGNAYYSIAFDKNGSVGVAVGDPIGPNGMPQGMPKLARLRVTSDQGASWVDKMFMPDTVAFQQKKLRKVASGAVNSFWAGGAGGLVVRSSDGGVNWTQVVPSPENSTSIQDFQIYDLAFGNGQVGIFVGERNGHGVAYLTTNGTSWSDISPTDPDIAILTGVDLRIAGNKAWAVGRKTVAGEPFGVVLKYQIDPADGMLRFVEDATAPPFPSPRSAEDSGPFSESVGGLESVLLEVALSGEDVWVGGDCGRVWQRDMNGAWEQRKSQMSLHIQEIDFPSPDMAYLLGKREWTAVTRYNPLDLVTPSCP